MKKIACICGAAMLLSGCFTTTSTVKAPKQMEGVVKSLRQEVSDCFKAKGFTDKAISCKVQVTLQAEDAGEWRGIPLFRIEGGTVAGVTYGPCGGSSSIKIGKRADGYWDVNIVKHELCHAEDFCLICDPAEHPIRYRACCPHWPYLGSTAMKMGEVNVEIHEEMYCFVARISDTEYVTAMVPNDKMDTFSTMDVGWYKKVADWMKKEIRVAE